MTIKLSGGEFGGASVAKKLTAKTRYIIINHAGNQWVYDINLHADDLNRADFVGYNDLPSGAAAQRIELTVKDLT